MVDYLIGFAWFSTEVSMHSPCCASSNAISRRSTCAGSTEMMRVDFVLLFTRLDDIGASSSAPSRSRLFYDQKLDTVDR